MQKSIWRFLIQRSLQLCTGASLFSLLRIRGQHTFYQTCNERHPRPPDQDAHGAGGGNYPSMSLFVSLQLTLRAARRVSSPWKCPNTEYWYVNQLLDYLLLIDQQSAAENLVGYSDSDVSLFKRLDMEPIRDLKLLVRDYPVSLSYSSFARQSLTDRMDVRSSPPPKTFLPC